MDTDILIRLLLRFIVVPLGVAAAIAACTAVIVIAHYNALSTVIEADAQAQQNYLFALVLAAPVLLLMLSILVFHMFVPAAIGVIISEALALRSWIYHAANGGISAWFGWALTQDIRDEYRFLAEPTILIAAGLLGGLVYWAVAGWSAGFWKPARPERRLVLRP